MGVYAKWIILIVFLLVLVTFGVENSQTVQIKYYLESLTIGLPQYVLVYTSIILGILIGMGIGVRSRHKLRKRIRKLDRENTDMKDKVTKEEIEEDIDQEEG
jgi:uncharacterized integral membrane protein